LWDALLNAFENDRAAARGEMNPRKLIVFQHEGSSLGNARSGQLFDLVAVKLDTDKDLPRRWEDYTVSIDMDQIPSGVTMIEKL
jgi:CRISPR-associated protein Csd2